MKTLVELLEGDVNVNTLHEENIAQYVQTQKTIQALEQFVLEPFKAKAKEYKPGTLFAQEFDGEKLTVTYAQTSKPKFLSPSALVNQLDEFLRTITINNAKDRQMYGVKRFGDVLTIDAIYLRNLFTEWQETPIGENIRETVTYKGPKAANKIAAENRTKLIGIYEGKVPLEGENITCEAVKLYIAADKQVKALRKKIIAPFEKRFKETAEQSDEKTIFDNKGYGNITVQVVSIPQTKIDYESAVKHLKEDLDYYVTEEALRADDNLVYFNKDLEEPRNYVIVDLLQNMLEHYKNTIEVVPRQEVNILYRPEDKVILSVD